MKILLASDVYKYYTSGVAKVVITLADALREEGHEVRVLSLSNTGKSFREGDDFYISSAPSVLYPQMRVSFNLTHPYLKELCRWKPDVIHVHTESSALRFARAIAGKTGVPVIMTLHTDYAKFAFHSLSETPPVRLLAKFLTWCCYREATMITVPSEKAANLMKGYHIKKLEEKIRVVPNGIKLKRFQQEYSPEERARIFSQLCIPDNGKLFVIVSRLSAEKNIQELLHYFVSLIRQDEEVFLLITGDGPYKQKLERLAEKLGISANVIFTGRISQDKLYRYYKAGIAFLSASTFETQGLTNLEAMACGTPLICRDDPCLKGILENGYNGYIYKTEEEFLERCTELLRSPELHEKLSKGALERAASFGEKCFADQMTALYRELCTQSSGGTTQTLTGV